MLTDRVVNPLRQIDQVSVESRTHSLEVLDPAQGRRTTLLAMPGLDRNAETDRSRGRDHRIEIRLRIGVPVPSPSLENLHARDREKFLRMIMLRGFDSPLLGLGSGLGIVTTKRAATILGQKAPLIAALVVA